MTLKPGWLAEQVEEVSNLKGHWCYQHQQACLHTQDLKPIKIEIILEGYPKVDFSIPIKIDGKKVARVSKITRCGMRTTLEAHVSKKKVFDAKPSEKS